MNKYIVLFLLQAISIGLLGQSRWFKNYYSYENTVGKHFIQHYDNGYLLAAKKGINSANYYGLLKTDINGDILWEKIIGHQSTGIIIVQMAQNESGDTYISGATSFYSQEDHDPLIMKINACGEKEWCRVIIENEYNYAGAIVTTPDGGVAVILRYMNELLFLDRIGLARFDVDGNLLWKHYYNSTDTALSNEDGWDLTLAPDGGFLISATCRYENPDPPHMSSAKPYYIKTDSQGNVEWENVIYYDTGDNGGEAWSTVLGPNNKYYYSSLNHYYRGSSYGNAPALLKMDLAGSLIDIYNLVNPTPIYGKLIEAKFISDTTLMGSAVWNDGPPVAVVFDTLGNLLHQAEILNNNYLSMTEVSYDNKLLYMTNIYENDEIFNTYLFKFNSNLLSDTNYNGQFVYDSLCPYQITNDTIIQDNCGLIVGENEDYLNFLNDYKLNVYPNPTSGLFRITNEARGFDESIIEIFDIKGNKIKSLHFKENKYTISIDASSWPKGIYVVSVLYNAGKLETSRVFIQ